MPAVMGHVLDADPTIFKLCDLVCGSLAKEPAAQAGVFRGGS
jgi:hypothetical protein